MRWKSGLTDQKNVLFRKYLFLAYNSRLINQIRFLTYRVVTVGFDEGDMPIAVPFVTMPTPCCESQRELSAVVLFFLRDSGFVQKDARYGAG